MATKNPMRINSIIGNNNFTFWLWGKTNYCARFSLAKRSYGLQITPSKDVPRTPPTGREANCAGYTPYLWTFMGILSGGYSSEQAISSFRIIKHCLFFCFFSWRIYRMFPGRNRKAVGCKQVVFAHENAVESHMSVFSTAFRGAKNNLMGSLNLSVAPWKHPVVASWKRKNQCFLLFFYTKRRDGLLGSITARDPHKSSQVRSISSAVRLSASRWRTRYGAFF